MQTPSDPQWEKDAGTAIVGALWLSLILALMALTMISMSKNTLIEVRTSSELEARFLIAEAGLSIAKNRIASRTNPWMPRTEPYSESFDEDELEIHVTSPKGKIDLNYGAGEPLRRLLIGLRYEEKTAVEMVDRLQDYVDEDDLSRLNGAEQLDYDQSERPQKIANAPLAHIDELSKVLGFTQRDVKCLSPFVTIFSQSSELDLRAASNTLKAVLGVTSTEPSETLAYRRGSIAGQVYEVTSEASYSPKAKVRVREIIRYTGIPSDPVWVHTHDRYIIPVGKTFEIDIPSECPSQTLN